jgi:hypothetical protein
MDVDQEAQAATEPILRAHSPRDEREPRRIANAASDAAARASTQPRCSPDPHAGTDRYRLAAPFSFRL